MARSDLDWDDEDQPGVTGGCTAIVLGGVEPDQVKALVSWERLPAGQIGIVCIEINGIAVSADLFSEETLAAWCDEIAEDIADEVAA
jgi:hypothetical protein